LSTHAQFSRVLQIASVLALGMTSSTAIAQNGPPPFQTEQQEPHTYVGNIVYVGRGEGWTPLTFERFQGLIFFQGKINGAPATILLDNGFSHTTLDAAFARRIGLTIRGTDKTARSGTEEVPFGISEGVSIEAPNQLRLDGVAAIIDLSAMSAGMQHRIDAVLGGDLLGQLAISIHPSRNILMLVPSGSATPRPGMHSREIPLVAGDQIEGQINGQPVRLQIDLGSNGVVTLSDDAWKRVFPDDSKATKVDSIRVEGANLAGRRITGNTLSFSGTKIEGAPVDNSGPLPGSQDGLLGQGILSTVDFILDIPAKKLILMRELRAGETASPSNEAEPK
jgi:predicted aspartyl protease